MIHIFHGFLGSPDDFCYLASEKVKIHDLYENFQVPAIEKDDILIGYSMGGRIALELADKCNFQLKKLILISAHPGLSTEEEKEYRKDFEKVICEKLGSETKEDFLNWWNSLPLFNFDAPITTTDERFKRSFELFNNYKLSDQKDHLPNLTKHKDKIIYVVGLFDEKYMELVSEKILPAEISVKGIPGTHRLFQYREDLVKLLNEEGIL
jgi:2-succinyl-6-hydroxy-2,4-cyclohexadiene-1-carboxylate synthase